MSDELRQRFLDLVWRMGLRRGRLWRDTGVPYRCPFDLDGGPWARELAMVWFRAYMVGLNERVAQV